MILSVDDFIKMGGNIDKLRNDILRQEEKTFGHKPVKSRSEQDPQEILRWWQYLRYVEPEFHNQHTCPKCGTALLFTHDEETCTVTEVMMI